MRRGGDEKETMGTLVEWLTAERLEQYAKLFADNDIDFETLAELTDGDLEKLGVSLGHRRKLQKALEVQRGAAAISPSTSAPVVPVVPAGLRDAERRQVTVLFCDLVGSTELANVLDPEDTSALIWRYQDACAGAITRFDGFVAKFMGDGVLAYFGYPGRAKTRRNRRCAPRSRSSAQSTRSSGRMVCAARCASRSRQAWW